MAETRATDVHPPYLYPDYKSTRLRAPAQPLRSNPRPAAPEGPPASGPDGPALQLQ